MGEGEGDGMAKSAQPGEGRRRVGPADLVAAPIAPKNDRACRAEDDEGQRKEGRKVAHSCGTKAHAQTARPSPATMLASRVTAALRQSWKTPVCAEQVRTRERARSKTPACRRLVTLPLPLLNDLPEQLTAL